MSKNRRNKQTSNENLEVETEQITMEQTEENEVATESVEENNEVVEEVKEPVVEEKVEPKKEETPVKKVVEPVVEEPIYKTDSELVMSILRDNSIETLGEKLKVIKERGPLAIKVLISSLESYEAIMKPLGVDENVGVKEQYNLLNILRNVVNHKDDEQFNTQFRLVNLFYMDRASGVFNLTRLARFDYKWAWSAKEWTTLINLNTLITTLADASKRAENLRTVSLDGVINKEELAIPADKLERLRNFYTK
jgi:hypothetical protein